MGRIRQRQSYFLPSRGIQKPVFRLLTVLLLILAGCSSASDPAFVALGTTSPSPGMARLVVYYPPAVFFASNGMMEVDIDGDAACRMKSGRFMVRDIAPGKHKLVFSICGIAGVTRLQMEAVAGEKYYLKVSPYDSSLTGVIAGYPSEAVPDRAPPHPGPFQIERMDESKALAQLQSLRYAPGRKPEL